MIDRKRPDATVPPAAARRTCSERAIRGRTRGLTFPEAEALLDCLEACGRLPAEVAVREDDFTVLFPIGPPPSPGRHAGSA
jgi:hypothetical protein